MAFDYKLEFAYDESTAADASVFIQMRNNPPVYMGRANKEDYDLLPPTEQHIFTTTLFAISGVTELATNAYRVWIMKSPAYTWTEVLSPALDYMKTYFGQTTMNALPGSGNINGEGFTLSSINQRRKL